MAGVTGIRQPILSVPSPERMVLDQTLRAPAP